MAERAERGRRSAETSHKTCVEVNCFVKLCGDGEEKKWRTDRIRGIVKHLVVDG